MFDAARHAFAAQHNDPKSRRSAHARPSSRSRHGRRVNNRADAPPHPCRNPMIRVVPSIRTPVSSLATTLALRIMAFALSASILKPAWERMNMFISAPSLTLRPKDHGTCHADARRKALESPCNKSPAHECAARKASPWRRRAPELLRRSHNAGIGKQSACGGRHKASPAVSRSRHIRRSVPVPRQTTKTRRIDRNGLVCGHGIRRDCRPADGCAARAQASPRQDERSRASLSCPWKEAWTKSATFYPAAEAAAPDQSTRPCSDAANQSDPSTHGFRDCNPWQGGGASVSILILIAAPKKGVGN